MNDFRPPDPEYTAKLEHLEYLITKDTELPPYSLKYIPKSRAA